MSPASWSSSSAPGVHSGGLHQRLPALQSPRPGQIDHPGLCRETGDGHRHRGLFNIQFIVKPGGPGFIIEVNPRSSRTVPFLSKATGYSLADMATLVSLGISLRDQGITAQKIPDGQAYPGQVNPGKYRALYPGEKERYYVKVPAFSFSKLQGMDAYLSPEMKSTGEAIGYDRKLHRAMYSGPIASGVRSRSLRHRCRQCRG